LIQPRASEPPLTTAESSREEIVAEPFPSHRWGLGAFLLVEAVLILTVAFIGALYGVNRTGPPRVSEVLVGTMLPTILATATALLITRIRGNGPKIDLRITWRWADVVVGIKLGLAGLVLTSVAVAVWTRMVGPDNSSSALNSLLTEVRLPVAAALAMFLYVWLIGPLCEEIIFRGLCWGALERLRWGRWAVFLISTAVFAASHLEPLRTSLLLVISIPIGAARLITGRLPASIIAHQVNNFLPALVSLLVTLHILDL
jgi:membrane protease YdiL (CAAX protease family)